MKYVALSDLHLGQNGVDNSGYFSLLSNIPRRLMTPKAMADYTMSQLYDELNNFANGEKTTRIKDVKAILGLQHHEAR